MSDELYVEEPSDEESGIEEVVNETIEKDNTDKVDEVKDDEVVTIRRHQNVIQDYSIDAEKKLKDKETISLPSDFDKEVKESLDNSPNINLADNEESKVWVDVLSEGLDLNTYNEVFVPSLEDKDALFKQKNEHNGSLLEAKSPKFKHVENQKLKGERAVIRVMSHLGLGTLFQVPLWHSGLWVTLKPPSESELIELNRVLMRDKIEFGRYTYGLAFSNLSSFTINRLVDFALAHVYDTTALPGEIQPSDLKNHISCQDIYSLLWGLVCTMYPKGFNYKRACSHNPDKCNHVIESTINVIKLQWNNLEPLTDWQKDFMASRQPMKKSLEEIKRYATELSSLQPKKIYVNKDLSNEIVFTLKTPTISEYIDSGYEWINNIVDTVNQTLGEDLDDDKRNTVITRMGQSTIMRQYSHWVSSIEYDTNIVEDRETINKTLDVLSSDNEIREEFIESIVDYINKGVISVIGIPKFKCPNCEEEQTSENTYENFIDLLPIDVVQLFFVLLTQKLERIITR